MKKILALLLTITLAICFIPSCSSPKTNPLDSTDTDGTSGTNSETTTETRTNFRIASLKGPTTMGMVKLMDDNESLQTGNKYEVKMYGTVDEIVTGIVKGDIDVACVPCNLSSVLYEKTKSKISVAAINTLGVLYLTESGNTINSVADLKGKTIYSTGKGTTPEYVLNYVLTSNGIDPLKDVTIEYKSEATELAAILSENKNAIALLPQPYITTVQSKNSDLRIALDMTAEWNKVEEKNGSALVTGVVIVRNEFKDANKNAFDTFLSEYKVSTEYVNSNIDESAKLVAKYEIVPEAIAKIAIPTCNITFIDGDEMKSKISGYLEILFNQNPQSVGGKLPDGAFYYNSK